MGNSIKWEQTKPLNQSEKDYVWNRQRLIDKGNSKAVTLITRNYPLWKKNVDKALKY